MQMYSIAMLLLAVSASNSTPTLLQPSQQHWVQGTGGMKGIAISSLLGGLDKPGPFVVRLRLPAGASWPAHYHKYRLNASVISGELLLGMGNIVNRRKMVAYPAGSFVSIPPNTPYYDAARGVTVVEESGIGPVITTVVAPEKGKA